MFKSKFNKLFKTIMEQTDYLYNAPGQNTNISVTNDFDNDAYPAPQSIASLPIDNDDFDDTPASTEIINAQQEFPFQLDSNNFAKPAQKIACFNKTIKQVLREFYNDDPAQTQEAVALVKDFISQSPALWSKRLHRFVTDQKLFKACNKPYIQ